MIFDWYYIIFLELSLKCYAFIKWFFHSHWKINFSFYLTVYWLHLYADLPACFHYFSASSKTTTFYSSTLHFPFVQGLSQNRRLTSVPASCQRTARFRSRGRHRRVVWPLRITSLNTARSVTGCHSASRCKRPLAAPTRTSGKRRRAAPFINSASAVRQKRVWPAKQAQ